MCVYRFFPQRGLEINEFDNAFASIFVLMWVVLV